jgi:hypothetical protein
MQQPTPPIVVRCQNIGGAVRTVEKYLEKPSFPEPNIFGKCPYLLVRAEI